MSELVNVDEELTLRVPQFFCCNCGDAQELRAVTTVLDARDRVLLRGFHLALELPYCPQCVNTAMRRPVGTIKKIVVAGVSAVSLGLVAMVTPLAGVLSGFAFLLTAAVVFAAVFGAYALQKPRGNQTSYHQPVRLTRVQRQRNGKVIALALLFSHERYARSFASDNASALSSGTVQVHCPSAKIELATQR